MRIETRESYASAFPTSENKIPEGKAILVLDNNGFVGTNNGWPLGGQPALYPENQARAIAMAWNFCVGKVVIEPEQYTSKDIIVPINAYIDGREKKIANWLNGSYSGDHIN